MDLFRASKESSLGLSQKSRGQKASSSLYHPTQCCPTRSVGVLCAHSHPRQSFHKFQTQCRRFCPSQSTGNGVTTEELNRTHALRASLGQSYAGHPWQGQACPSISEGQTLQPGDRHPPGFIPKAQKNPS